MLFVCSYQFVFSQSSFGIGLGVGHQFGLPGLRANYTWKRLDASLNMGLYGFKKYKIFINNGDYVKASEELKFNYCLGGGISFRMNKKQGLFPKGLYPIFPNLVLNAYITYNCGYIISYTVYNGYTGNLFYEPYFLHSLSSNLELSSNNHFKIRFGFGWASSLQKLGPYMIPTGSLGIIYSIKSKEI
jgi:hypothetical protein